MSASYKVAGKCCLAMGGASAFPFLDIFKAETEPGLCRLEPLITRILPYALRNAVSIF